MVNPWKKQSDQLSSGGRHVERQRTSKSNLSDTLMPPPRRTIHDGIHGNVRDLISRPSNKSGYVNVISQEKLLKELGSKEQAFADLIKAKKVHLLP